MLRKVSTLSIAGALIAGLLLSTPAYAAVSNGSTCTVVNKTTKVSGFTYKCVTAVKSTVTLDGVKTNIYIPATATTKNAKKYYLSSDCITQVDTYTKALKDIVTIDQNSAASILQIDAEILVQEKANEDAPKAIADLQKANVDANTQIVEQNDTVTKLQKSVADLKTQSADLLIKTDNLKASLPTLQKALDAVLADKKNTSPAKLSAVKKYQDAISATKDAINSTTVNQYALQDQIRKVNSDITSIKTQLLTLRQTISSNNAKIKQLQDISVSIANFKKSKEDIIARQKQAKLDLAQALNSRNLLCSAGL